MKRVNTLFSMFAITESDRHILIQYNKDGSISNINYWQGLKDIPTTDIADKVLQKDVGFTENKELTDYIVPKICVDSCTVGEIDDLIWQHVKEEENRAIKKEKKEIANNLMNYISEMVTNDDLLTSDMLRRLEEKTSNLIKYDF